MIRGLSHSRDRAIRQPLYFVCTPMPLTLDLGFLEVCRLGLSQHLLAVKTLLQQRSARQSLSTIMNTSLRL